MHLTYADLYSGLIDSYQEALSFRPSDHAKEYYSRRKDIPYSEYIKHVVRVHHRLTVIHPFGDGNGRTTRAFMNLQFVRVGLTPIYIKVKDKKDYVEALEIADKEGRYDELTEIIERIILLSHVELNQ